MGIESKIENGHLLTDIFGRWPSFRGAEVLRLTLDRGETRSFNPNLQASIHVFEMTSEAGAQAGHVLKNHVAATFRFFEVVRFRLEAFNHQNVLRDLSIVDVSDRQLERVKFEVSFDGVFGVDADFSRRIISIESVEPYLRGQP